MANNLLHTPAEILRAVLVAKSLGVDPPSGTTSNWPCYFDAEPDNPDRVVTVYDTTGIVHGHEHVGGRILEHAGFQIRVRGITANEAYLKADSIRKTLSETASFDQVTITISGSTYYIQSMGQIGNIIVLGKDKTASLRSLCTINGTFKVRKTN